MPTFFAEGDTPRLKDSLWRITQKILGGLSSGSGGVGGAGGNYSGAGAPEGVQAAPVGSTYVDTNAPGTLYFKASGGSGNTGWV